ncbi:MAG TPA: PBP1A family penicillin-binding protein [Candidatus Saccharimonadaceae bacterium]|nr:PBP1A family penicillin-binding protein [Candidatus Saccharimonadaceae bacterium]
MVRRGIYSRNVSPLSRAKRILKRRWREFRGYSKKKKALIIASPIVAFLVLVPLGTYLYYYHDISNQQRLMNANNTGVVLLDDTGKTIYTTPGRTANRTLVPLSQISPDMQHALVASEDKNFYTNDGFSITGILRALYDDITSHSIAGGGSTITQQLAKNTLLNDNQTLLRKYQELTIAVAIDHRYSKDQILDMYLNSVFFGGTNFGVSAAAKFYFNTTPDKLDLAQSAMLVGVLPAPNAYSPTLGNLQYAQERQAYVLGRMKADGYITSAQEQAALAEKLTYATPTNQDSTVAPAFVQMVLKQLYQKYGQENVLRSGFEVTTTLNLTKQQQLEAAVQAHVAYINRQGGSNAAAVAEDPRTGDIRALVGSVDWNNPDWGKVNMATSPRQPGSSFKTIYYTGALANGTINPATILHDVPTDFNGYEPHDADMRWLGNITVRQAISQSRNVPSVEVMQKYGVQNAITTAQNLGITTIDPNHNYGLSLALGSAGVPLTQMVGAYSAIANGGMRNTQTIISSIDNKFGKTIYTEHSTPQRAISEQASFLIANILSDYSARAPIFGNTLTVPGHPQVAVKTGTTDDDRDAWTIGFTPTITVGVWVGNNNDQVMQDGGSDMAGPIWTKAMADYLAGTSGDPYTVPVGVVQRNVCYGTDDLAATSGTNTYKEYFMAQYLPSGTCDAQQKVTMITVCDLADNKMTQINENDYNSTEYSKDPNDCKQQPTTIQVCDLATGQVVAIDQSDYDPSKYSMDTANCQPPQSTNPPTTGPIGPVQPPGNGSGNGNGNGSGGTPTH